MTTTLTNILSKSFLFLLLTTMAGSLAAQQGNNPFEIPNRTPAIPATPPDKVEANPFNIGTPTSVENQDTIAEVSNPFDLGNTQSTDVLPSNSSPAPLENKANPFEIKRLNTLQSKQVQTAPSPVLQPQKKSGYNNNRNFLFGTSILLLLLFTILLTLYKPLVNQIYRAFLNDNMLKLKHREQGSFLNVPFSLLYLSFFLNAGFFVYLYIVQSGSTTDQHLQLLLKCILAVLGIFLIKHLVLRLLGYIFPIDKELRQYSFTIVVFNIILGILLLPFNLLIAFGPGDLPKYLIYSFVASVLLFYGFRIIRSLLIASRYISLHKFHFFMYLCTIEIAPTIVLVKLLLLLKGGAN